MSIVVGLLVLRCGNDLGRCSWILFFAVLEYIVGVEGTVPGHKYPTRPALL